MSESTQTTKDGINEEFNAGLQCESRDDPLSDRRRRLAVAVVEERSGSISASELATEVATRERDELGDSVPDRIHRRTLISLVHCHLPKLDEAGLVEYDADDLTVEGRSTGGSTSGNVEPGSAGEIFVEVLEDERRRTVLSVLDGREASDRRMDLAELAASVAARERDVDAADLDDETRRRVEVSLHHTHLPKLKETGLIVYDAERRSVALAG